MLIVSQFITLVKILGTNFFVWSMPFAVIVLNILKGRDIFEINVLIAFVIGLIINIAWDIIGIYLEKKEYHKNLLWYSIDMHEINHYNDNDYIIKSNLIWHKLYL